MPNWCLSQIVVYSKNKYEIELFHDKLEEVMSHKFDEKVGDPSWLGNLCIGAGYTYDETIADRAGYCRGWIQYISNIETNDEKFNYFYVDVEDAWEPHIKPWRSSIERLYPANNIKIAWIANECGCEIYQKYDPNGLFFSSAEYSMDCYCDNDEVYEKYPEIQEGCDNYTTAQLMKIFNLPDMESVIKRAEEITEAMEEEYGEGYVYIHKYEEMESEF